MEIERGFKGIWIPREIWLNKDLTLHEKLFLVEINSLDNDEGCFATNSHFSEFFGVSKGRCTQIIKSLEAKNMISITIERDGKIISKRVLKILNTPFNKLNTLFNKLNTPIKNIKYPYLENAEESNTSINNTNINNTREKEGAFSFLQTYAASRLETFLMQHKSQIKDWDKFVLDFEATVVIEKMDFDVNPLFERLGKYARNWILNINSGRFKNNNQDAGQRVDEMYKKYASIG